MSTDNDARPTPVGPEAKPMTRDQARERAVKGEELARVLSERLPEGAERDKALQAVKHFERARERLDPKREATEERAPAMKSAAQETRAKEDAAARAQADQARLAQQRETAAAAARETQQRARRPQDPDRKPLEPDRDRD